MGRGHRRRASAEEQALPDNLEDLEELYEDVYDSVGSRTSGKSKDGSGRSLVSRPTVSAGGADHAEADDELPRQKSGTGRRAARRSAQAASEPPADSLVMPIRASRSFEGLAAVAAAGSDSDDEGAASGSLARADSWRKDKKKRSKDRKQDRQAKREKYSGLINSGSSASLSDQLVGTPISDAAQQGVELMRAHSGAGFPDADLKLGFAAIKNRLQKSLIVACASADSSEQLRRKHGAVEEASDVWKSEHFWLELRARVYGMDPAVARQFISEQRAKLPDLVDEVLKFEVGPGEDQELRVDALLVEVAEAQDLYHTREKLRAGCWEWKLNEERLEARLHHLTVWKQVGALLKRFHVACNDAFDPPDDTYAGWVSCLARTPSTKRVAFYKRWVRSVMDAMRHRDRGLASRREQCREMGLSDLGSDIGRAVLMLLRLFTALPFREESNPEHIAYLVEQSKQMLRFVFETKVGSWSKLLAKNTEFVGLMRGLFTRYFELITHEKWRLRRRVQVEALHSFVLEHRSETFDSEWQFASEMKNELRDLLGDSEETFAMGFLELCTKLLSDGMETAAALDSSLRFLPAPSLASIQHLLVDDLKFCKRVYAHTHLSAVYEVRDLSYLRRGLLESGHRIFRLPSPPKRTGQSTLERVDSRDKIKVVLAVPAHMADNPLDITVLLQAWCSTNDDVNGHVLVMEDDGGWDDFDALDTNQLFGLVPGQGLDSSMDFGMRPGCLHIVAASVFALQRQRREFETMGCRVEKGEIVGAVELKREEFRHAREFCRVVAEQEASFKPARECLEQSNVQALQIAETLLQEVADLDSVWQESEMALCSLAFHVSTQATSQAACASGLF